MNADCLRPKGEVHYLCIVVKRYCYLYTEPSSVNGRNLGQFNNGEYIEILDWYEDTNYAKVRTVSTRQVGYIAKDALTFVYTEESGG